MDSGHIFLMDSGHIFLMDSYHSPKSEGKLSGDIATYITHVIGTIKNPEMNPNLQPKDWPQMRLPLT